MRQLENDSKEDVEPESVEEEMKVDVLVGNEEVVSDDDDDTVKEDGF